MLLIGMTSVLNILCVYCCHIHVSYVFVACFLSVLPFLIAILHGEGHSNVRSLDCRDDGGSSMMHWNNFGGYDHGEMNDGALCRS